MSKILKRLSYLDFPECSRQALQYLTTCLSSSSHHGVSIPGLEGAVENYATEVCLEYVYFMSSGRKAGVKKLNAREELHLLEILCSYLNEASQGSRYSLFNLIFGGNPDGYKINLLTKLVSMALSLSVSAVLDCAALWMQEQGCHSKAVCDLSHKLVEDYCILFPDVSSTFQTLPSVSPLFTCNFITAVATIFTFNGNAFQRPPPINLLECITNWVSSDPCLCSESVRLVRIQANFSCPFSGLVQWCVLGHLVTKYQGNSVAKLQESVKSKTLDLLSKLHFGILQSLLAYKSMELNQELFLMSDFVSLAQSLIRIYNQCGIKDDNETLHILIERVGQIIQLAMVTGSLKDEKGYFGLGKICEILPQNRLLEMIVKYQASPRNVTEFMDTS